MNKVLCIGKYEFMMQMKRLGGWLVLIFALAVTLADDFPSLSNLTRLEFLSVPSYFVLRVIGQSGLILLFGLMFLLSNRIQSDRKTSMKDLFASAPISKTQYIMGKLTGNFIYAFFMLTLFLVVNVTVHSLFNPVNYSFEAYVVPLLIGLACVAVPACIFVTASSVMLPVLIDIRLFYLLFSVLFIMNTGTVASAERMPFYLITHGELAKLIWLHPKYPILYFDSITWNLVFLLGAGLLSVCFVYAKRKFWRAD